MDITLKDITVAQLVEGYSDDGEGGVVGYQGRLDIRPPYQREFVYGVKERDAVIDTIVKGFPLNVMYWAVRADGTYEIIDGQQRTISIAQYVEGDFSFHELYFHNLPADKKQHILDYTLMVYVCAGSDSEKLGWFKTINIAGKQLTNQELRNAVYAGPWLSDAKRYFSRRNGPAYHVGRHYLSSSAKLIRQGYLETAIRWKSANNIEDYMGRFQHEPNASELWAYFQAVIGWVERTFTKRRSIMKGVNWGSLYNEFKDDRFDPDDIEQKTAALVLDDDVTRKRGIYDYLLTKEESRLNIRAFSDQMKIQIYEQQDGICTICGDRFEMAEMEADHITPWSEGGKTEVANCQMVCREDNRRKGAR